MRILFRIIPLCMLLLGFVACDDEDEAKVETLEVTPANLNGTWQLVEWNGESLAEGTYCYITLSAEIKLFRCIRNLIACMPVSSAGHSKLKKMMIWDIL